MFLHKGEKLWEGTRDNIMDTNVKELQEFVFASSLMRAAKKVEEELGSLDEITTIKEEVTQEVEKDRENKPTAEQPASNPPAPKDPARS
jgi:phospholipid/cholesterol/gamma-HCH transport system ATP-binding protein